MNSQFDTLIVAAHPDDEVLGCGGTIARLASEGCRVKVAILGEGLASRNPNGLPVSQEEKDRLRRSAMEAARILGVPGPDLIGLPDNRFDSLSLLEIVKVVEELIDRHRPVRILTHSRSDLNIDHGIVHRAVLTASRPVPFSFVREVLSFEVPSSTEWSFSEINGPFLPNVFVDVRTTIGKKIAALEAYEGEIRQSPHPRSRLVVEATATRWGSVVGIEHAEPFQLIWRLT